MTMNIDDYLAGPRLLREAVSGVTPEHLIARPIPGKWSILEVVCHLADYEIVAADRIKRVIADNEPMLISGDREQQSRFAARLAYHERPVEEELSLIEMLRRQFGRILRTLKPEDFQRRGIHSVAGPMTLENLVERMTRHIPHHIELIEEKKKALGV
jgi:hypothetical protein